jgi:hypothetical protein
MCPVLICYLLSINLNYNAILYLKGKGFLTVLEKVGNYEVALTSNTHKCWVSTPTHDV